MAEPVLKIIYLGNDIGYLTNLRDKYDSIISGKKEVAHIAVGVEPVQELLVKLIEQPVNIIYLDLTSNSKTAMQLLREVFRNNLFKEAIRVALVDNQSTEFELNFAASAQAHFIHIKCAEMHDVVYSPVHFFNDRLTKEPQYATAKTNDHFNVYEFCKINWVNGHRIKFEYNRSFNPGDEVHLHTNFLWEQLPSEKMVVSEVANHDLYYESACSVLGDLVLMEPEHYKVAKDPKDFVGSPEDQLAEKYSKFNKWLVSNVDQSRKKNTKLMIVSKNYKLLTDAKEAMDQFGFSLRYQPFLIDSKHEVMKFFPDIIAFDLEPTKQLEPEESEESDAETEESTTGPEVEASKDAEKAEDDVYRNPLMDDYYNDHGALAQLVDGIKANNLNEPFIVVFGGKEYDSKALQYKYQYPKMMSFSAELKLQIIVDMTVKMQAVKESSEAPAPDINISGRKFKNPTFYFKKFDPRSVAGIKFSIDIISIREHEVLFLTKTSMSAGTIMKVDGDIDFYITVVPHTDSSLALGGKESYRGLINGVSEEGKREIRSYINSVFFRDKEAEKQREKEEYEALNESVKLKKMEEEAARVAEKLAKEEAEEKKKAEEKAAAEADAVTKAEAKEDDDGEIKTA